MIRKHISNNDKNYTCIIILTEANKAWNHMSKHGKINI